MKNPLSRLSRARDKPQNKASDAPAFYFGGSLAGKSVSPRSAVQVSAVYACVRVIAETIASLPLHLYMQTDDGSVKAMEHPLYRLLHDEPNSEMTSFVFRETMATHLLLWGNSYSQIIRNGRGEIHALYPLLAENMEVDRVAGQLVYAYRKDGMTYTLHPRDVLHIPGLGFDGVVGYSPIALERNAIGLGIAAEEYGSKFFSNGATPAGVLTHPSTVKDPERLRKSWNRVYGGSANAGQVAILEEGLKFDRIAMPNNEAQFLETRKFQVSEICRIYRVPPHLIGDLEHATFSNIEHQGISFAQHTIRPWLVRIEQSLNRALLSENEKVKLYAEFNMSGLLRGDFKSRMDGYAIGIQNGFMSPNDVRELESMNRIPGESGSRYYINGNMLPLEEAGAFASKKEAAK